MEEGGLKGFVVSSGFGIIAPANTARPIVDRVYTTLVKVLAEPAVKNNLSAQGAEPVGNRPEEYEAFNKSEIAKWLKVTRDAGILPE
jgi:tripartite-type tricarboxylate transporter receptor subunit TctC